MASKSPVKKPAVSKPVASTATTISTGAFDKLEAYLEKNQTRLLLILPLVLGALFAALTFDVKISEGNDDAMYIEAATKYAADFTGYYYTANAPMYPMLLGVVTMITGFNLTIFKLINTFLFLLHLAVMYFAFRKRIPYTVLLPVLILSSVNAYYLYFASQTYTEMLFVTLQALFFLVFFTVSDRIKAYDDRKITDPVSGSKDYGFYAKSFLLIGLVIFLMTFCKNIAIGTLGAVMVFFVMFRNWRMLAGVIGGFVVIRLSFEGIKALVWGASNQYGSQGSILLQKDAYNAAAGQEDLNGFITRFFENFNLYTSKRLFQVLGFKDPDNIQTHTILSLLVVFLLVFAAIRIYFDYKKNQEANRIKSISKSTIQYPVNILFVLIYVVTLVSLTYLVLQTRWDQPRLIMIYVPLLMMVVMYGFYSLFNNSGFMGRIAFFAIAALLIGSSFLTSVKKSIANIPVLRKNLQGDIYYGYTDDWANFLKLSAWCGDSLPPNSFVASRKAPMSFVYAKGKAFYPVYSVIAVDTTTNLSNADSVLALFRENKVTHVLLGSLRRNPKKADGYIINTLHRMLQPVAQKYPQKVKLIKQIGATEPAYLYEVKY